MNVAEDERKFIYKHFGHSEETNVNIYQAPLALKELTVVGRRLDQIDKMSVQDEVSDTSCLDSDDEDCFSTKVDTANSGRNYTKWSQTHWKLVQSYFHMYITGKADKRLPGKKEVMEFLTKHKEFPHDFKRVKTKIMNEVYKRENKAKTFCEIYKN